MTSSYQVQRQMEREEDALFKSFECGEITQKELNAELNAMQREYAEMAEDAAQEAYRRERDYW